MDAAEAVTDRMVRRELYKKAQANRITKQLTDLEIALTGDLSAALARLSAKDESRLIEGSYTTDRLKWLIALVQGFSEDWTRLVKKQLESGAIDLIELEIEFERNFLATFAADSSIALSLDAVITPRAIFTAAKRRPMTTTVIKEAYPWMTRNVKRRVTDSLRISYQAGDTIGQAVRRLRSDSQLGINRRGAAGLVRTGLAHFANQTTLESLKALGSKRVRYLAVLDGRTSEICMSRSGREYDIDDPRLPSIPAHIGCRSTWIFADIPIEGTQSSKGASGGKQVPAEYTYEMWLRKQPDGFARDVLGETRYRIWKSGKPVTAFTDKRASVAYSAAQLRQKYADIFAGDISQAA